MIYLFSTILLLKINGPITPSVANYVRRGLRGNYSLAIIEMDTPGGLDKSMRIIIKSIINSRFPVIGFVYPQGARCASAGTFIITACHLAVMSPGTSIGAAHPVMVGNNKIDEEMSKKIENDAVAFILSLAEMRKRNKSWLEKAVRESITTTALEAESLGVIDFIAKDIKDLLRKLEGKEISFNGKQFVLTVADEKIEEKQKSLIDKILDIITQPEIAYLLLLLGMYGIIMEIKSPGAIFPGVLGGLAIILSLYSFNLLPVNYAGLLLIIAGIVMFILEIHVTSYGLLTIGGIASFIMGSLMLFPERRLRMYIIVSMIVVLFLLILVLYAVVKAHKRHPMTGIKGMIGEKGIVRKDLDPEGLVFIHGEIWNAESITGEKIKKGEKVEVKEMEGLKLKVKKLGKTNIL